MEFFERVFPSLKIGDMELDEDIGTYWESLDEQDRKWSKEEEHNARKNLANMRITTDDAYAKLKSITKSNEKTVQGVHSYDILANPNYV